MLKNKSHGQIKNKYKNNKADNQLLILEEHWMFVIFWTKLLVKFSDRASVQSTKCSTTGACACSTESLHNLVLVLLSSYFRNIRQRLEYFHLLKRQIIFLQVSFQFDVRRLVAQTISIT